MVLREIRRSVSVPVIAIGGITMDNVHEVITAGADGVAVISAVVGSKNITAAAQELRKRISESKAILNVILRIVPISPFAYRHHHHYDFSNIFSFFIG